MNRYDDIFEINNHDVVFLKCGTPIHAKAVIIVATFFDITYRHKIQAMYW